MNSTGVETRRLAVLLGLLLGFGTGLTWAAELPTDADQDRIGERPAPCRRAGTEEEEDEEDAVEPQEERREDSEVLRERGCTRRRDGRNQPRSAPAGLPPGQAPGARLEAVLDGLQPLAALPDPGSLGRVYDGVAAPPAAVGAAPAPAGAPGAPGVTQPRGPRPGISDLDVPSPPSPLGPAPTQPAEPGSRWAGMAPESILADLKALGRARSLLPHKASLLALLGHPAARVRAEAVRYLSRLHRSDALAPEFLTALQDSDSNVQRAAVDALSRVLSDLGSRVREARGLGALRAPSDWGPFISAAPPILQAMLLAARDGRLGDLPLGRAATHLDALNLMTAAQKREFLRGFTSSEALLMAMSTGAGDRIGQHTGLHSDTAKELYAEFERQAKGDGQSVSRILAGPGMSAALQAGILTRLLRYGFLSKELARDPELRAALPGLLFRSGSRVNAASVFSIGELLRREPWFAEGALRHIRDSDPAEAKAAAAYLLLRPGLLKEEQKAELARWAQANPEVAEALAGRGDSPPMYAHWTEKGLDVAVVMTQAGHAAAFVKTLRTQGYRVEQGSPGVPAPGNSVRLVGGTKEAPVRIRLRTFASDAEGWARDLDAVGAAVAESLSDPSVQAVVFRGHAGDNRSYWKLPAGLDNKVLMELSCDSAYLAPVFLKNCRECGYIGTNVTMDGATNNRFLPQALKLLARRASYADLHGGLQDALGVNVAYRYTLSPSQLDAWRHAAGRFE